MQKLIADVTAFHVATETPVSNVVAFPTPGRQRLRYALISEEANELLSAIDRGVIDHIAGEMVDLIYVVVGAAIEYGIPLERVWDAIQAANMAKVDPATGKVRKRADGKVLKPEGWQPADLKAAISGVPGEGEA